jgi:hypothetical protein
MESQKTGGVSVISYTPGVALPEGEQTLYVQAADAAGNWSVSGAFTILIDISPPIVNAGNDIPWVGQSVGLSGTVSDVTTTTVLWEKSAGTGILVFSDDDNVETTVSGPADMEEEYTISFTAVDVLSHSDADTLIFQWDSKPPAPGDLGSISITNSQPASLTLVWTGAVDGVTAGTNLEYKIVRSTQNNITSTSDAELPGEGREVVRDWIKNITSLQIAGLTEGTEYFFNVLVRDGSGNTAAYGTAQRPGILNLVITVATPQDETITFDHTSGIAVSLDDDLTITIEEDFDAYAWYMYEVDLSGQTGKSVTIDCSSLSAGIHSIVTRVELDGMEYSKTLWFDVRN